jgi:uncharacterized membrane protein YccC
MEDRKPTREEALAYANYVAALDAHRNSHAEKAIVAEMEAAIFIHPVALADLCEQAGVEFALGEKLTETEIEQIKEEAAKIRTLCALLAVAEAKESAEQAAANAMTDMGKLYPFSNILPVTKRKSERERRNAVQGFLGACLFGLLVYAAIYELIKW